MEIELKGARIMRFKLEHCKPENHEVCKTFHIQRLIFQEEKALKRGCITLNNNFLWKWQIFGKRKNKQKTQGNFGFLDLEKSHQHFTQNLSQKSIQKVPKTFFKKTFFSKDPRKNPPRGSPKFPKDSFKENCPKSLPKILQKKIAPKSFQKSPKVPLFTTQTTIFIEEDFESAFKQEKTF